MAVCRIYGSEWQKVTDIFILKHHDLFYDCYFNSECIFKIYHTHIGGSGILRKVMLRYYLAVVMILVGSL